MARGAEIAAEAGADIIDINFGCPSKRVTNGYAGSALMRVPDVALALVEAVAAATTFRSRSRCASAGTTTASMRR